METSSWQPSDWLQRESLELSKQRCTILPPTAGPFHSLRRSSSNVIKADNIINIWNIVKVASLCLIYQALMNEFNRHLPAPVLMKLAYLSSDVIEVCCLFVHYSEIVMVGIAAWVWLSSLRCSQQGRHIDITYHSTTRLKQQYLCNGIAYLLIFLKYIFPKVQEIWFVNFRKSSGEFYFRISANFRKIYITVDINDVIYS